MSKEVERVRRRKGAREGDGGWKEGSSKARVPSFISLAAGLFFLQ